MRSGGVALVIVMLAATSCSTASRELRYRHPSPAPGVVYVAEQVSGLEEWSRDPASRAYARIYTRDGGADEGRLARITPRSVVLVRRVHAQKPEREVSIAKADVLFMRVWW